VFCITFREHNGEHCCLSLMRHASHKRARSLSQSKTTHVSTVIFLLCAIEASVWLGAAVAGATTTGTQIAPQMEARISSIAQGEYHS